MFAYRVKLLSLFGFQVWIAASWLLIVTLIAWTLAVALLPAAMPDRAALTYWWMALVGTIGLLFPVLDMARRDSQFTALYSNTARAHQLGHVDEWVIVFFHKDRAAAVAETCGPAAGQRVVLGREADCGAFIS